MTPLSNGSDYYKKMLELQERLRKSESERIRLEERFTLLEHESRSRHETCINRLRMRYIEFLEEQQARDERNHRLLGALDRVDSSLALMSAKTDRLGALRKQYETSLLSAYNNRANGSMTGDSGVASQNDDRHRRSGSVTGGSRTSRNFDRSPLDYGREKYTGTPHSLSHVRSDPCYANWPRICYENSQQAHSPIVSARYPQGGTSFVNKTCGSSASRINCANDRSLPRDAGCIDRRMPQSTPIDEYRFKPPRFTTTDFTSRTPEVARFSSDWQDSPPRRVMRDLANCGAYDSYNAPSRLFNDTSGFSRVSPQSTHRAATASSFPVTDQAAYTRVTDMLRRELGDEEEQVGSVVENELERYISKIRNLHRDADPQSAEDPDHEQNTSGDLLNVTLSDDGLDLSAEDKPRRRALPQHLGNVLTLAKDLANRSATSANNLANAYNQDVVEERRGNEEKRTGAEGDSLLVDSRARHDDDYSPSANGDAVNQLTSVNPLQGETEERRGEVHDGSNENFSLLAKNGISAEIAKVSAELAARPRGNIEDLAKSVGNSREIRASNAETGIIDENARDEASRPFVEDEYQDRREDRDELLAQEAAGLRKLEDAYKIAVGEEHEAGDDLRSIAEDLEPWNINALERRVQVIILNDEAQADFISRSSDDVEESRIHHENQAVPNSNDQNIHDRSEENRTTFTEKRLEEMSNEIESTPPMIDDQLAGGLTHEEYPEESSEQENRPGSFVDPNINYETMEVEKNYPQEDASHVQGEYPQEPEAQYDYTTNEQYQGDPNAQYENYNPDDAQYAQDANGQYHYDDQQYQPVYAEDPNLQPQYQQNSNEVYPEVAEGQQYAAEGLPYAADNNLEYPVDSTQQYATEANYEQYAVEQQQYQPVESYQPGEDQPYPAAGADYNYPEGQQYADPGVYESNAQPVLEENSATVEEQESSELYEPGTNFEDRQSQDIDDTLGEMNIPSRDEKSSTKKSKDVIKSLLDSDTESTIEKNVSNAESDYDFN